MMEAGFLYLMTAVVQNAESAGIVVQAVSPTTQLTICTLRGKAVCTDGLEMLKDLAYDQELMSAEGDL